MPEKKEKQNEEIRKLVIERLKTIPADKKISIGKKGDFTIDELIKSVEKNDRVGKKIVEAQMTFLQSLKTGDLLDE
ncbi:MAG: hypothetical protein ACTSRA_22640 [Promethearchaeota archaeon]